MWATGQPKRPGQSVPLHWPQQPAKQGHSLKSQITLVLHSTLPLVAIATACILAMSDTGLEAPAALRDRSNGSLSEWLPAGSGQKAAQQQQPPQQQLRRPVLPQLDVHASHNGSVPLLHTRRSSSKLLGFLDWVHGEG